MASNLPEWAQWVQAIGPVLTAGATVIIGVIVAYVAWRQWRTAREKLVLDLFDRRMGWHVAVKAAVKPLLDNAGSPEALSYSVWTELARLQQEGMFLFGDEIFKGVYAEAQRAVATFVSSLGGEDGRYEIEIHRAANAACYQLLSKFPAELRPYMRMTQKL